jgi:hypothetical protein
MNFITKLIAPIFLSRIRDIERYGRNAEEIQRNQLCCLLREARNTKWGKEHGYGRISDYEGFRKQTPVMAYEAFAPYIERMVSGEADVLWRSSVRWYAKSSGTTNDRSKYIPVTREILHRSHYQGAFDTVAVYLHNNPGSRFFSGKGLILGGSHSPSQLNSRSNCGDLSAVLLQNLNPLVNLIRTPRKKIILMDEWEAKVRAIVESTWNKDIISLSGIPSWMLTLLRAVLKRVGKTNICEVWPNLEVFFHGGVGFEPYRPQYASLIPSSRMKYMETYNASEGFFGLQDTPSDKSMLLMLDYGIFYEFIPVSELERGGCEFALPIEGVKLGENYAVVISTCGGLWRYLLGDTVSFTSANPYKFVITGRTKLFINAFGEELMVDNAERAIRIACEASGALVRAYTAAPQFLPEISKGRHRWLIEYERPPISHEMFVRELDSALKRLNSDYEAKRYKDISLIEPTVTQARENLFFDWLKKHDKLGGQHKIPALQNDEKLLNELLEMNR